MKYLIVIEKTKTGYSAYSPDLDGCVVAGSSQKEVKDLMQEAVQLHLEGLREEGFSPPQPHTSSTYLEISA